MLTRRLYGHIPEFNVSHYNTRPCLFRSSWLVLHAADEDEASSNLHGGSNVFPVLGEYVLEVRIDVYSNPRFSVLLCMKLGHVFEYVNIHVWTVFGVL